MDMKYKEIVVETVFNEPRDTQIIRERANS